MLLPAGGVVGLAAVSLLAGAEEVGVVGVVASQVLKGAGELVSGHGET